MDSPVVAEISGARDQAQITKVQHKLANPFFTQKVPRRVLLEHGQRLADWRAKLEDAKTALDGLSAA